MSARVNRRSLLAGTVASGVVDAFPRLVRAEETARPALRLRLLATSDIHMFVMDWDYYRAKVDPTVGLVRLATHIKAARSDAANTLLFDNGDFLQGNPLADHVMASQGEAAGARHPMIEIMAELGYDAIGLGNHEFNYGLDALERVLGYAPFPVVCANIVRIDGRRSVAVSTTILERTMTDTQGHRHVLRIGVIGFVPPQIMVWDRAHLEGRVAAHDIVLTAKRLLPNLRKNCDVLVALSHSGIGGGTWSEGQENASFHLAGIPGIDAIVTGHSHLVFPGPQFLGVEGVDAAAGKISGIPAVMPGFWGSHLGVIDVDLEKFADQWRVVASTSETRPIYRREGSAVVSLADADPGIVRRVEPSHRAALEWVEQPVGATQTSLHSYFIWAGHDPCTHLVNEAQLAYASPFLERQFPGLPILSTAAPFRAGYTPDGFVDIAPGPISLRQVADIYVYSSNTIVAVKVTGAEIIEWLEFAARAFNTVDPRLEEPQPLLDRKVPSFNFDTFLGLDYEIDLTVPARYDSHAKQINDSRRVRDVRHDRQALASDQVFLVVTNNYRGDGGGAFPGLSEGGKVIWRGPDSAQNVLAQYLRTRAVVAPQPQTPWRYARPDRSTSVYFETGHGAARHVTSLQRVSIIGEGDPGYLRVALRLE